MKIGKELVQESRGHIEMLYCPLLCDLNLNWSVYRSYLGKRYVAVDCQSQV